MPQNKNKRSNKIILGAKWVRQRVCVCVFEHASVLKNHRQTSLEFRNPTPHHHLPHPIISGLLPMISVLSSAAIQTEYVHRLRVRARDQVISASAERERYNRDAALEAATQFKESTAILGAEYTNHSAALTGSGNLRARGTECQGRQRSVMCVNHCLGMQIDGIENLHLTRGDTARIGQITVLRGGGESAQPLLVAWCITYGVHHLHILYVVYIERLLQADNQSIAIQFHGQYCV